MFGLDSGSLAIAAAVALLAGTVKGAVGFAMPMILISGLASFLPADQALAALVLPTLATNLAQALRQGLAAAWASTREYRLLLVSLCLTIALSAQLVPLMPRALMLLLLGGMVIAFSLSQLAGWQLRFRAGSRARAELAVGLVGGFFGGISGVWGPPTIALLISLGVGKRENVRVQGVVYLVGSLMLFFAHLGSGVVNADTLPLSAALVVPSMAGLFAGFWVHDRLDAGRFRRWTLIVLALTGLNLIRRALTV
ncbi:sulfite exporter TauE/SafE family protein [Albidovulum sp.]